MRSKNRIKIKYSVPKIILTVLLFMHTMSLMVPLIWALNSSLKSQVEYSTYNMNGLPEEWLFINYKYAFSSLKIGNDNFFTMIGNSLWYAFGVSFIGIGVSSMVAYVMAKYKFPGRSFIYSLALIVMMIPIIGSQPSQFRLFTKLGILDSPLMLIAYAGGLGFNFLVLFAFFRNLPWSFAEAAFIDGAGHVRVFLTVMMPQAVQPFFALALVAFINMWNDYTGPLLFLKSFPTLSSGLYMFQMITTRQMDMPVLYAGLVMSAVPIIALFALFSDKIMSITLGGGIKG